MSEFNSTPLEEFTAPVVLPAKIHTDDRGIFKKVYQLGSESIAGIRQVFWSQSNPGVIRGMHFSSDLNPGYKMVSVVQGEILDVLINLRESNAGEKLIYNVLNNSHGSLLVPQGYAHGFQVISEGPAVLMYLLSNDYLPDHDVGIHPLSAGISWPKPVSSMSPRDSSFEGFDSFRQRISK
jgi:dTDP-4-dehydrorhamnose 3,5-epimerase